MNLMEKISNWFSVNQQIGLDLGSAFVRISLPVQKKILTQPSVVAKNTRSDRIVAIGEKAQKMMGRTPEHIETIHPIVEGMIDDSQALEALISMLLYQHSSGITQFTGQNILVTVPASVTDVSTRIISTTLEKAGARQVLAVPAGLAALVGVGAPVGDPAAQIVVNVGAGLTQITVVSNGDVVAEASSTIAGNQFDAAISRYVTDEFGIRISGEQARRIKHRLAAVRGWSDEPGESMTVSGQDEASQLPREITLSRIDVTEAIDPLIADLAGFVEEFIGSLSSDMAADIKAHGLHLIGGTTELPGLNDHLAKALGVTVHGRVNPSRTVIEGVGHITKRGQEVRFTQPIQTYESTK